MEYSSPRKTFFYFLVVVVLIIGIGYGGSFAYERYMSDSIVQSKRAVMSLDAQLDEIGQAESFNKLEFARNIIADKKTDLRRSDRIQTIIDVVQKLQSVSYKGGIIRLFDFAVDSDTITLKGETVNIALLYATIPGSHTSLFDTFKELPFVRDLSIKQYQRAGSDAIAFTLTAHLLLLDTNDITQ